MNDRTIRSLKPKENHYEVSDDKVAGLSVRVHPSGKKNFFVRYQANGKRRRFTLSPDYPALSLSEARDRAREVLVEVSRGNDPQGRKEAYRMADTFADLVDVYRKQYLKNLKSKTQSFYNNAIDRDLLPEFGHRKLDSITRRDIIRLLDKIAHERDAPIMANRVKAVLSSVLSFGVEKGNLEYNPALQVKPPAEEKSRERVLSDEELKSVWEATSSEETVVQTLFRMLILLGQRSSETRNMEWSEIKDGIWEIPSSKTKADRVHILPLPQLAMELLSQIHKETGESDYVFETPSNQGSGPIKNIQKACQRIQKRSGVEFQIHDLRRTMATGLARLGFNRTVIGKVINHKGMSGDHSVTAIYDRYDYFREKGKALESWSKHIQKVLEEEEQNIKIYRMPQNG